MLELAIDGDGSEWEQVGTYVFLVLTFCGAGAQVKKTPRWPRSWANFSLLQLYSHMNA